MKRFKKFNFSLSIYMCDILFDFYERNELEHCCALESLMGGNFHNEEQKEWLRRFNNVWERVEERDININSKGVSNV